MTITAPVHADVLPEGPSIDDPDNFDEEADLFVADLRPFGIQMNALSDNVYANALATKDLADAAAASASTATDQAGTATTQAGIATTKASIATTKAQEASDSATAAANSATGLIATSTSSVVLGNGSKVFAVATGKQFTAGVVLQMVSVGTPTARMFGTAASYVGTTLTATVTQTEGPAGTYNDWVIAPGGAQGPTGGTAGGSLTGPLNAKKGAAPASSATPDVWNAGGNYVPITQTAAITGLPNAPQAGAARTLKAESTFPVVSSANFFVHGGSTAINPGDELDIVADTVSTFLVTVRRNTGTGNGGSWRNVEILLGSTVWTAKVSGLHRIILVAGCGSGGLAIGSSGARVAASGGSGGGLVIKDFYANAGDAYTLVLGARGAGVTLVMQTGNQTLSGNDAADSTFTGNGVSLVAGGGKKGVGSVATSGNAVAVGAVGGTASGGDFNFSGGPSGTATASAPSVNAVAATGGAVVTWRGTPYSSGTVTTTGTGGGGNQYASGGAGVGGKSGDVIGSDLGQAASGGAGANGPSSNVTTPGLFVGGPGIDTNFSSVVYMAPLRFTGQGTQADISSSLAASSGAGSGAVIGTTASRQTGQTDHFGGTGGLAASNGSSGLTFTSGTANYGGASGGVAFSSNSIVSVTVTSGAGGAAFAIIQAP
ncbi:hypothetical protein [Duganella callida]|uniref:Uncharacterized protein n=1 Tax=Duganella callida TaxID=2561932 RepID=A0A4Y9S7B8_9BURK|nr:hypothetical protein [Duganella callida]TFW15974.1 hypothetical protein E4L98_25100 [Duganella callida]